MTAPSLFTWVWAALFATGGILELVTVFFHLPGGPLSWSVRHFVTGLYPRDTVPRPLAVANRVLLAVFFTWLIVHFDLGVL